MSDAELTALVASLAEEFGTPGISAGVVVDGRTTTATVGVTSTLDPLPVDDDTLFAIGSTSKTFTATAVMALVDAGRVALTDRVVDHLPGFTLQDEHVAKSVTVGHLLNHTSGWRGDLSPATGWGEDALERALVAISEAPQELPLGETASYSNSAFMLAGHLLATVCGTSFEEAVQTLVLGPLGLTSSFYLPWDIANRRHAVGHTVTDGVATPVLPYLTHRPTNPVGGMWSSLRDQLAWAQYHLAGATAGTAPLLEPTRLLMQQSTVTCRSTIDGIGLGWLLNHQGDVRLVSHGGNLSNLQTSTFVLAPDHGFAVTVMTNAKQGAAIGARVQAWALEHYLGIGPQRPLAKVPFDPTELVGLYDLGPYGWSLRADGDRLFIEIALPAGIPEPIRVAFSSPPRELVAVARDVFALAESPVSPFLDVRRAGDGSVEGIMHGMRFVRRSA